MVYQNSYQMEGEEHDWEYHATVFVYITSSHAKHLKKIVINICLYTTPLYTIQKTSIVDYFTFVFVIVYHLKCK